MKKKYLLRLLICLILSLSILLSGCDKSSNDDKPHTTTPKNDTDTLSVTNEYSECATFDDFCNTVFKELLSTSAFSAHFLVSNPSTYELEDSPNIISDNSESTIQKTAQDITNYLAKLKTFDYDSLTEDEQLTYDLLLYDLEQQNNYANYYLLTSSLSPTNGDNAQLPVLLSEFNFNSEEDIKDYLEVVQSLKEYFANIEKIEKKRSEQGFAMSDDILDGIIAQCENFISQTDDNFLITTFDLRIDNYVDSVDNLSEDDIQRINNYKADNKTAVIDFVIPSYEGLIKCLESLIGTCKNDTGLAGLANGKEYYAHLASEYSGSSKTVDELWDTIDSNVKDDLKDVTKLIMEDPSLIDKAENPDIKLKEPTEILNSLQEYVKEDFPDNVDANYTLKYVEKDMQQYLSPAFYIVAPIDNYTNGTIYINQNPDYSNMNLFSTLAHEGYPGHLYQTAYFYNTEPSLIRNMLNYPGYTEGYATYVSLVMMDYSGLEQNMADIQKLNTTYSYGLYSLIDIGVNYKGWTLQDLSEFLLGYGIQDEATTKEMFNTVISDPAVYLSYYVGCIEIMALRDDMTEAMGDDFNLKEFHTKLLNIGPARFENIREQMGLN